MSALENRDINSAPFTVGTYVNVRCLVTAISGFGAGALVTCAPVTPGNVGEVSGVSFQVSPTQCRKAGASYQ
jgi:hypothetical protein